MGGCAQAKASCSRTEGSSWRGVSRKQHGCTRCSGEKTSAKVSTMPNDHGAGGRIRQAWPTRPDDAAVRLGHLGQRRRLSQEV